MSLPHFDEARSRPGILKISQNVERNNLIVAPAYKENPAEDQTEAAHLLER